MKKLIDSLILLFIVFFVSNQSVAVRVPSVYQAEIPVVSQLTFVPNKAAQQALQIVLIKTSGNTHILENLKGQIPSNLNSFIQEYRYLSFSTNKQFPYLLKIYFDPKKIDQLLQTTGTPIWGVERPLLLIWAIEERPNGPAKMMDNDSSDTSYLLLKQYAGQRGIPIIFPMIDLNDLNQLSANDILNQNIPVLENAAKRYHCDGLLILHIKDQHLQAKLVLNTMQHDWQLNASSDETIKILMNQIADLLANQDASLVNPAVQTRVVLNITGITHHSDLLQLMHYLKRLTPVLDVQPIQVSGQEVVLSLILHGTQQSFEQVLTSERKLIMMPEGMNKIKTYQWNSL